MMNIATPAVDMYKQFDHANELEAKGEFQDSLAEWQALAANYPDDSRIRNNLGSVLDRIGRPATLSNSTRRPWSSTRNTTAYTATWPSPSCALDTRRGARPVPDGHQCLS